ncbi:RAB6A-GEF complex partner protein 2-like [Amphibalanus amphitrite]|uniref:RAB6A-GEF complex partner protein 2-like n=1 Tax=Amphibalanus amphitrite TaxID=1232801 RepID=UPI001C913DE4|nr:RAB6A-GEF complex partner protein 2-like [Amphibalanus amphitrite]XP_043213697.1 RAB6A-GEF complex partner protein 2-like [Amphibalanus amphitrite]XP_043213698.1 RAB6A-GEF complex partner protein 2-like [Amphibalanus amphitrite]XP_043213699.1 RAB6A-GEF complex partner protein 2-like [Amphibalanus amphitrite]
MIEVICELVDGPVFLAGQTLRCTITLRCPELDRQAAATSNSDVCENLAWVSAQVQCFCQVNDHKVRHRAAATDADLAAVSSTAYLPDRGERGRIVLATKPTILVCDLRLRPGQAHRLHYSQKLPADAMPTYLGQAVRYVYKVTVGAQRVNSSIRLLRVPVRLLPLDPAVTVHRSDAEDDITPSNPFLPTAAEPGETSDEQTLQLLQHSVARRAPAYFNITNQHGRVVRFCMFKTAFKLGEDVVATLDFSESDVRCVQYSVTLESVETVHEQHQQKEQQKPVTRAYNKCHEVCLNLEQTHVMLPVPLHVTPSFRSELVELSWRLHFEFVTTTGGAVPLATPADPAHHATWEAPDTLPIETMVWDLPVRLCPTSPGHVAQALHMAVTHTVSV